MKDKTAARQRRARQTRHKIRETGAVRLTVHRTNGHIYAQITSAAGAEVIGQRIAAKAKEKGIDAVAFDRAGYRYHGRIKALAEAARAGGLKF